MRVLYISACAEPHRRQAITSIASLRATGYRGEIVLLTDAADWFGNWVNLLGFTIIAIPHVQDHFEVRHYKTQLHRWAAPGLNLFLDTDTFVVGPLDGLELGASDVMMALDGRTWVNKDAREAAAEAALTPAEKEACLVDLVDDRYFNSGVILFDRNPRTKAFFDLWNEEWLRFEMTDQPALWRAINRRPAPCHIGVLEPKFNRFPPHAQDPTLPVTIYHYWSSGNTKLAEGLEELRKHAAR